MRSNERRPTWQHDVRWIAALALVVAVAFTAAASSLARVTAPAQAPGVARALLSLAIGPSDELVRAAPSASGYRPGEPLTALPGVPVEIAPDEITALDVDDVVEHVAVALGDRVLSEGATATWAAQGDEAWRTVLERAEGSLVRPLVVTSLRDALFDVGVGDGRRAANWPQQAQQNPGAEVQPLVGVFVTFPPLALQGRSAPEIGTLVVERLADALLTEGADAVRDRLGNAEVAGAFEATLAGPLRATVVDALAALTSARRAEIESRLADARAVIAGNVPSVDPWAGLVDPADLGRLEGAERRERVLDELAQRAALGGSEAVLAALPASGVRVRVERAAPVIDAVDRDAHRRATTLAWVGAGVALVLTLLVVVTADGFGRVTWPGVAWLLGAGPGLALAWGARELAPLEAWPSGPALEGAFVTIRDTLRVALHQLAPAVVETVTWAHLVPAGVGAAFVLIGLSGALAAQLRPSRRGRF